MKYKMKIVDKGMDIWQEQDSEGHCRYYIAKRSADGKSMEPLGRYPYDSLASAARTLAANYEVLADEVDRDEQLARARADGDEIILSWERVDLDKDEVIKGIMELRGEF